MTRSAAVVAVIVLALAVASTAHRSVVAGEIEIDAPIGGYRNSGREPAPYLQDVRYPASSVNTPPDQPLGAVIRGRIAGAPKDRRPHLLIVNGVPMPLAVDEAGQFSRPFAFARGSNGVEVRAPAS